MCGITGIYNLNDHVPVDEMVLRQMLGMLVHRGPDGFGIYLSDQAGLGSARLSIIDIEGGDQPIGSEDGRFWIVFNGEVFNYIELRPGLEQRGHIFRTQSDTEVILHLYEEYGPGCLKHLNGQFALAIWDEQEKRLFLARDRVGVRPLFYTLQENQLIFGSEIKALLAHPAVPASLDPASVDQVFTFWSVLPPATAFTGIFELPPGHFLLAKDGAYSIQQYWSLDFQEAAPGRPTLEYIDELESLLVDAARIRLRSDVPVGAYLSGGLDSSLTSAIIQKYTSSQLSTFSISFSDPLYDESRFQRTMARHLGTSHQVISCAYEDIARVFPEVVWHAETPILRTASAPMFLLSDLVHRNQFKVVVTGEGADEFLAGYDIFKEMKVRRFWARRPESTIRPLLLNRLYPDIEGLSSSAFLAAFFKRWLDQTGSPFYSHIVRWTNTARALRFRLDYTGNPTTLDWKSLASHLPAGFSAWSPLSQAQYLEVTTFLSSYLLSSQGDRMAMAHSVEGRYPFLDYRVIEFCNRLPSNLKLPGIREKWLLKQLGKRLLPTDIWRRTKKPYRAPIYRSFFYKGAPEYITSLLSEPQLKESALFEPASVEALMRKAGSGLKMSEVDDMALVGILSTQLLYQRFVKDFRLASLASDEKTRRVIRSSSILNDIPVEASS